MQSRDGTTTIMPVACDRKDTHAFVIFRSKATAGTMRGYVIVESFAGAADARNAAHAYLEAHPKRVAMLTRIRVHPPKTYTAYALVEVV